MKQSILSMVLLFFFVMIPPAPAADQTPTDKISEITIASEVWEDATNKDGTGLYWDIIRAVYEPAGIKVKIKLRSYAGSIEMVKRKRADAMVASALDEVEGFNYPTWHMDTEHVTALFKKDKEWKGVESMKGKKVAYIKDYAYDTYFVFPMNVMEYGDQKTILKLLNKGRVDFWLDALVDMETFLKKTSVDRKQYRMEVVHKLKLYLGFVGTERGKKLAEIFDNQFEKLVKSGEIQKLFDKWKQGKFHR